MRKRGWLFCLVISLSSCLLNCGTILLPGYTLSARVTGSDFTRSDECVLSGDDWRCVPRNGRLPLLDQGAISWQEYPIETFYNHSGTVFRKWNPYAGSGDPVYLDGLNRGLAPTRIFLRYFPGDRGHDFLIFAKVFLWTWFCVLTLWALSMPTIFLVIGAFFAPMLSSVVPYSGIDFSDVDLLAPAILAILLLALRSRTRWSSIWPALLLGLWIGAQTFVQAQMAYALVFALVSLVLYLSGERKVWRPWLAFSIGFLCLAAPYALDLFWHFPVLISSRSHQPVCYAQNGQGWRKVWDLSLSAYRGVPGHERVFDLAILSMAAAGSVFDKRLRQITVVYVVLLVWVTCGFPSLICRLPGISGTHFGRYLVPQLQYYLFILSFLAISVLLPRIPRPGLRKAAGVGFFLLVFFPFAHGQWIAMDHLQGKLPRIEALNILKPPPENIFAKLGQLSELEDRRHFSPDGHLYPDYSSAVGVLDMRVLGAMYPKSYYDLNHRLFAGWTASSLPDFPDRFVGGDPSQPQLSEDLQRVLVLHRVSLLSFSKGVITWLPPDGPYSAAACPLVTTDERMEVRRCPQVGPIGFFPSEVKRFASESDIIDDFKRSRPSDLLSQLDLLAEAPEAAGAEGQVTAISRQNDRIDYQLAVSRSGYFVYADTWFPGWRVTIDGQPAELVRANLAFKAVIVPEGNHAVSFQFTP